MEELLQKLSYDPKKFRIKVMAASALLLVVGMGLGGWLYARAAKEQLCRKGEEQMAEIWGKEGQKLVRGKFLGTQLAYAQDSFSQVQKLLNAYAADWAGQYQENCAADRADV
jgi:hypothetical protein